MPGAVVNDLVETRQGIYWIATGKGLVRFDPLATSRPATEGRAMFSTFYPRGDNQAISALGQSELRYLELPWTRNSLEIDFVSPGVTAADGLRYQIMLEGADPTWSNPTEQRTVRYANLAAGRYRFLARAVNADGMISSTASCGNCPVRRATPVKSMKSISCTT